MARGGTDKALPGSAHIPSVATGVRPHTKRSKIGDRGPVHVGTWYASRHCDQLSVNVRYECRANEPTVLLVHSARGVLIPL